MKNNKYKIVVLSDLKDSAGITLKSTVSLAKMINGDIEFFHVKKPTEIIERENQLSAIRDINEKHLYIEKKIQNMIAPISKEYDIKINYKFTFGNVKNEIDNYILESQPDIIVLGKRKPKTFNLLGDGITQFVLERYNGVVMIAADENAIEPNKELSLGVLNGVEETFNIAFAEELMGHSQKPLKSFKILKDENISNEIPSVSNTNTVEYVFEQGDNAIENLSKYLSKSNVNLLFVDRINNDANNNNNLMKSDLQSVMDSLNVSLFLGGGKFNHKKPI